MEKIGTLPELLRGFVENDICSDFAHAAQEYDTRGLWKDWA